MAYCQLCSRKFGDQNSLNQHLKTSSRHSWCDRCKKDFKSGAAKQRHLRESSRHNICTKCAETPDFETSRELKKHLRSHSLNSETSRNTDIERSSPEYLGISRSVICSRPQAAFPTAKEAALRTLPVDNTANGIAARKEKQRLRAAEAKQAEKEFLENFKRLKYDYLNEDEQRAISLLLQIFDSIHLLFSKKYTVQIGPGAVVYRLGFETDHIKIEGVKCLREKEVLESLVMQVES
ncbi:hypothetical protein F5884DRAFT_864174 [Xylogone sp. PMI_703]|nr:hypothetical protein F5884DRAFT_864174 [Xylogone sp. PMI_703]